MYLSFVNKVLHVVEESRQQGTSMLNEVLFIVIGSVMEDLLHSCVFQTQIIIIIITITILIVVYDEESSSAGKEVR